MAKNEACVSLWLSGDLQHSEAKQERRSQEEREADLRGTAAPTGVLCLEAERRTSRVTDQTSCHQEVPGDGQLVGTEPRNAQVKGGETEGEAVRAVRHLQGRVGIVSFFK